MKIHYTSGSFYIEKDGKKIKIANPEELPIIQDPLGNGLIWDVANDTSFIESGDTFDLPKELSVEVNIHHENGCSVVDLYSSDHVTCDCNPSKVARLSKSNDSKISNSSEKPDFMKMANECHAVSGYTPFFRLAYELGDKIWNDYVIPRDKTISELQGKIDFYRTETAKIRDYVSRPSIGRPTQGIFDAIMDEFKIKDKTISDLMERVNELENGIEHLRECIHLMDDIAEARESVKLSPKMTIEELRKQIDKNTPNE